MTDATSQERRSRPARLRAVLVLATATGGAGAHVRSLAEGLVARGVAVTVAAPASTEERFGFTAAGARFAPVEIGTTPRPSDMAAARAVREAAAGAHVVHAHGLRAGLVAASALGRRRPGRTPLVLTLHNAVLATGPKGGLAHLMEGRAVRAADVVLGASADLVDRARKIGAADARLGPVGAPPLDAPRRDRDAVRAELTSADRPIVLAIGRLAPQKDYPLLLDAVERWTQLGLDPVPMLAVAGDGPLRDELQARIDAEYLPVRLLGHRDDIPDLFAAADIAVLSARWEARSLVAQEALRMGVPLIATAVGGIPELVGDAAVLVPHGDPDALAAAVADLLGDPKRRESLAELGRAQAESWPDEHDTVEQVLSVYEELGPS
ncbi:glycosyltransferase family 4 protein [Yinghuangia seranimata]|uniref:glycosyltransferase family 4 protein n=1 Tax=Yinghuangia seranimata TaxID=408067 RepID=UPI00248BD4C5|nr:glycosyltransferase family 4 protein [Yinghuangia seranimata]MDI2131835.1 glycosyltransferase family 4 protein [Yinghuangia seranimata]